MPLVASPIYRTFKVSGIVFVTAPDVAVTDTVYVPADVWVPVAWPPPPHALSETTITRAAQAPASRHCILPCFNADRIASIAVRVNAAPQGNPLVGPNGIIEPATLDPVVCTETEIATGAVPFRIADAGETPHVDPAGPPLHTSETDPVAPFQPETRRLYTARLPAVTVAVVDPPVEGTIVISGVATVILTVATELSWLFVSATLKVKLSDPV